MTLFVLATCIAAAANPVATFETSMGTFTAEVRRAPLLPPFHLRSSQERT